MKSKKNWYTLLEIMIVLGVIIVIMTITMRFSSSRIDDLQIQTSKDDFKNNYEQLLLSNMSSNYHDGERYSNINITMQSWTNGFTYTIKDEAWESKIYTEFSDNKQIINRIITDNQEQSEIQIQLMPYKIGCKILVDDQSYTQAIIQTQAKNKTHCFKITTNICKFESMLCSKL